MEYKPVNDPRCTWEITSRDPYKLPPNTWRTQCTKDKVNGYPGYCEQHMKRYETQQWKLQQRKTRRQG